MTALPGLLGAVVCLPALLPAALAAIALSAAVVPDLPTTWPANVFHNAEGAVQLARNAPDARYFLDADLKGMTPVPERAADGASWTVTFLLQDRPRFQVRLDDATGRILEQTILDDGKSAGTPGEALDVARQYPPLAEYLDGHRAALLDPRYQFGCGTWLVRVLNDDKAVGAVTVWRGRVTVSQGPWDRNQGQGASDPLDHLRDTWNDIRPSLSMRDWLYVYVAVFVILILDPRRLISWRTADALALAALLPAGLAIRAWWSFGYAALWIISFYLFVRALLRGLRPKEEGDLPSLAPATNRGRRNALVVLLAVVLIHQAAVFRAADWRTCDYAGLIGGEHLIQRGALPFGGSWSAHGMDTYGPVQYLLYGLAAQAFPTRVAFEAFDPETKQPIPAVAGASAVIWVVLLATAGALVVLGRRRTGRWETGLLLAVAFALLAPGLGRLVGGAHRIPGGLICLALAAYPNPYLSGACLGLAVGTLWFPVFLVPLWLGAFRGRREFGRFAATLAAVLVGVVVLAFLGAQSIPGRLGELYEAAVVRQGGMFRGILLGGGASWWPWEGEPPTRGMMAAAYVLFSLLLFFVPRRKGPAALAALTAALIVGTQLWKASHRGEYVAWYLPVLLFTLFTPFPPFSPSSPSPPDQAHPADV